MNSAQAVNLSNLEESQRAAPVSASKSISNKLLTNYEQSEILSFYPSIWYFGENLAGNPKAKIQFKVQGDALFNGGFDDERGDYRLTTNDHVAYRYEVKSLLGKGSFGQVALCLDHAQQVPKKVAIKVIRNKNRFHRQALIEVKILQRICAEPNQECIVKMLESFYFRNHLCIAFELLDINLYEFVKLHEFKGHSLKLIRHFAVQILDAMKCLERLRIVHCDLKPENIMITCYQPDALFQDHSGVIQGGKIKVIDFGSSCYEREKIYTYIQSRFYRSPEVILGIDYGIAIDMWSFGCILAEIYTGYPLFSGEDESEQLGCIMEVLGQPPSEVLGVSTGSAVAELACTRRKVFFHSDLTPRLQPNSKGRIRKPSSKSIESAIKYVPERVWNVSTNTTYPSIGPVIGNMFEQQQRLTRDRQEYKKFLEFVLYCLEWDPRRRWGAHTAADHDFVTGKYQQQSAGLKSLISNLAIGQQMMAQEKLANPSVVRLASASRQSASSRSGRFSGGRLGQSSHESSTVAAGVKGIVQPHNTPSQGRLSSHQVLPNNVLNALAKQQEKQRSHLVNSFQAPSQCSEVSGASTQPAPPNTVLSYHSSGSYSSYASRKPVDNADDEPQHGAAQFLKESIGKLFGMNTRRRGSAQLEEGQM